MKAEQFTGVEHNKQGKRRVTNPKTSSDKHFLVLQQNKYFNSDLPRTVRLCSKKPIGITTYIERHNTW